MKHSLKEYNATSRLKAAAIAAANALGDNTPEAAYNIALLCESNTLQPGEAAISKLASAAVEWFAADIAYSRALYGLLSNYPPANEAKRQLDPAIMEHASTVVFVDEFNPAEIRSLSPYITHCAAAAMNFAEALQAVLAGTFAANSTYVDALKKENEAKIAANNAMEKLQAALSRHDTAEMNKANKEFAAAAMRYTGLAIGLMTATLPNNGNDNGKAV